MRFFQLAKHHRKNKAKLFETASREIPNKKVMRSRSRGFAQIAGICRRTAVPHA
jgi:hypothetical protein